MKRDIDLARKLLIAIEGMHGSNEAYLGSLAGSDMIDFHLSLLEENKLVRRWKNNKSFAATKHVTLTDRGCDVLEYIRGERVWKEIKSSLEREDGVVTIAAVVKCVLRYIEHHVPPRNV